MLYVYVLRSKTDSGFYIGYSVNLRKRLPEHRRGMSLATSSRGPWELVYYKAYLNQKDALGRERYLKSGAGRADQVRERRRVRSGDHVQELPEHPFQRIDRGDDVRDAALRTGRQHRPE